MHHAHDCPFIQFSENSTFEDGRSRAGADEILCCNKWKFM